MLVPDKPKEAAIDEVVGVDKILFKVDVLLEVGANVEAVLAAPPNEKVPPALGV